MRPSFNRAPLVSWLLLGVGIAACQRGGDHDDGDHLAAEELPPECAPGQEDALRSKILTSVNKLRIGRSHADMAMMDANARTLDALERCGEGFERICDADCAVQRASVHLFRAAAIPLLASKPTALPTSEADQRAEADRGLRIVDRALSRLPRQKGFSAAANADDTQGVGGYTAYLRAYASLQTTKASLQMAIGDVYYRRVSNTHAKTISSFVSDVLGDEGAAGGKTDNDLGNALLNYEEAYWTLLDTRTSLPNDANASPMFAAELNQVYDLTQQVGERLRSAREGKLYIGIDPSGLQGDGQAGGASLGELAEQLNLQRLELAKTEGQLDDNMQRWAQQSQELASIGDQIAELRSNRAIDLSVHKMQQLHESTERATAPLRNEIDVRGLDAVGIELAARVEALELQLAAAKASFDNDLAQLSLQREEDIIEREIEQNRLDLDQVRSAIDTTLARFNFTMQVRALEIQQSDAVQNRDNERFTRDALNAQIGQVREEIALRRLEITRLGQEMEAIRLRQAEVIANQVDALNSQIAGMQAELDFYTQNTQLTTRICAERASLASMRIEDLNQLKSCLDAGCGSASLRQVYQQLLDVKKQRNAVAKAEANAAKAVLQTRLRDARLAMAAWGASAASRTAAIAAGTAASVAASLIPKVTVGMEGIMPVATATTDPLQAVVLAIEGAEKIASLAAEGIQFGFQIKDAIAQAEQELASAEARLANVSIDDRFAELEKAQALAELDVRTVEVRADLNQARGQLRLQQVECTQSVGMNNASRARTQAEIAALQGQVRAQSGERGVLGVQLKQVQNLIQQAQATIRKYEAQLDELAVRQRQAQSNFDHFSKVEQAIQRQIDEALRYQRQFEGFVAEREALEKQARQYLEQVAMVRLRVNETQRAFINSAIESAEKATFQSIARLREQIANNQALRNLTVQLQNLEGQAREALKLQREELMGLLASRPLPQVERVIWDFEGISAKLTRGAGELLDYKREVLASTNYYYNAYRYRYNMLSEFVGRSGIQDNEPYIWTAADASSRLARCGWLGIAPVCDVSSLANVSTGLRLTSSTFVIHRSSPMFQELLRTRKTRFEFSEIARNPTESHALGDYVLWDEANMGGPRDQPQELRVVTFIVSFPTLQACLPTGVDIRHTGLGYQVNASGASMVMKPPVSGRPTLLSANTQGSVTVLADVRNRVNALTSSTLTIRELDRRARPEAEGSMPFVGYPLRGIYELTTDDPRACLDQIDEMNITVVFARSGASRT